jgi:hypothetical protein
MGQSFDPPSAEETMNYNSLRVQRAEAKRGVAQEDVLAMRERYEGRILEITKEADSLKRVVKKLRAQLRAKPKTKCGPPRTDYERKILTQQRKR